jgi:hypothetical protein
MDRDIRAEFGFDLSEVAWNTFPLIMDTTIRKN